MRISAGRTTGAVWRLAWVAGLAATLWATAGAAQESANPALQAAPRVGEYAEPWMKRHESMNARVKEGNVDLVFIGDSITQGWEGEGKAVWEDYYGDRNAVNLGISGDQTGHVLWRLENGNLDGISPKLAVVMIGTNNAGRDSAEQIGEGVAAVVQTLRRKLPDTQVLLLGIFPREERPGETREKLARASELAAATAEDPKVHFMDIGRAFLADEDVLPASVMPDFLHPNAVGYRRWAEAIEPKVWDLMGERAAGRAPKGFVPLFNGEDLSGWKGLVGDPEKRAQMSEEELATAQAEADANMRAHWSVVDGVLEFDGDNKGGPLCTARDYEDFELLVDWKIEAHGDSGIYLRGTPQVQIWDPAEWPEGSGGLYNNQKNPKDPLVRADNPIGEWNTFRIVMQGELVTVYLNDVLVVDRTVLENFWDREKPIYPSGQIELQNHGSKLWFKDLYIREIPRGEGWQPLFNGKDLTGWEQVGGDTLTWAVEDGMLYTTGEKGGGWLSTTREYGDFELELEFRVPVNGNSGVFIRAPREGNPAFEGSEIQVLDDFGSEYTTLEPWQYSGSVYATMAPARRVTRPAGEWQKMRIRVEGPRIEVWLNGFPIVEGNLDDHLDKVDEHPGLKRTSGYIGLQNHGSRLDYRNMRIREL